MFVVCGGWVCHQWDLIVGHGCWVLWCGLCGLGLGVVLGWILVCGVGCLWFCWFVCIMLGF